MIFISIASYRDPELRRTITECYNKARYKSDLVFGVCHQHEPGDAYYPTVSNTHNRVLNVPHNESRGACWARSRIQRELFDGEEHYLQLDSHHRFTDGWDATLYEQARHLPNKYVMGTYVAAYDTPGEAQVMRLDRIQDGCALFIGAFRNNWHERQTPVRARFVSGHFLFAPGHFVSTVPYDPELYFTGEEISLAVRAYTHGYDLYHPAKHILWHEFTRIGRQKHWDDHTQWWVDDGISQGKVKRLLSEPWIGEYGLGSARTLADYEAYSGLDFTRWTATDAAKNGDEP